MPGLLTCTLVLSGCGNVSHVTDEGKTEEPVWPSPDNVMFNHDGSQKGTWPLNEQLRHLKAGMNKDQIYQLIGRPHFAEGLFGVREWDYLFHFSGPSGDYTCQFKILFDKNMDAQSFFWKPENCMNRGEEKQKEKEPEYKETMPGDVLFGFDSSNLTTSGVEELSNIAERFKSNSVDYIEIEGFTDHIGNKKYNQKLSEKRAQAVKTWFVSQGFKDEKIQVSGRGDEKPVVFCDIPDSELLKECLQPNRRVEITGRVMDYMK